MNQCTRQVLHVPIIHSLPDMGTMGDALEAAFIECFGRRRWEEHQALTDRFWAAVRKALEDERLDYRRVDLYQDGLPVCGMELDIAAQAARSGSENHQLLLDLIAQGAKLVGTEDPALLLEEYHDLKTFLEGQAAQGASASPPVPAVRHTGLLARRDAFIAGRIGAVLEPGRTGILFMGLLHRVDAYLPKDVIVSKLRLSV